MSKREIDQVNRHMRRRTRMTLRQLCAMFAPRWDRRGLR